jgi:hypothetical protein
LKVTELAARCVEALNHPERSLPDEPLITLVGKHTLFPKGGGPRPKHLLCINCDGNKVWHYSAFKVLAALVAHRVIDVKANE